MRRVLVLGALIATAVIPVMVLAIPARSGASAAGVNTTTLRWHRLQLTNGWQVFPTSSNYGSPAWAVSGGIVYLRGAVHGGAGADLATLPPGARPTHDLWISYVVSGPTTGGLEVRPDGLISLFGPSESVTFSSLSGVSFPVKA